jgi:anti-sigma factor RsiW
MSGREHLSEDILLDAIYGIADADAEAHVTACPACAGRLSEWRRKRAAAETREVSSEFLAAQRREIYRRLPDGPSEGLLRSSRLRRLWAPALAAACAVALGLFVYHPGRQAKPAVTAEVSDAQLFGDVFSMEQSLEPSATAPVRALFQEQQ